MLGVPEALFLLTVTAVFFYLLGKGKATLDHADRESRRGRLRGAARRHEDGA